MGNITQGTCLTLRVKYYAVTCITLNARTTPAAFALYRDLHR